MADEREQMLKQDGNGVGIELQMIENRNAADTDSVFDFVKESPENIQNVEQLKTLVKSADADVNFQGKDLKTALHWAVWKGEADFVDVLLEAGAEIEQDVDGNTALHYAVERGSSRDFDIFKRLLPPRQILEKKCGPGQKSVKRKGNIPSTMTETNYYIYMATSVNKEGFNVLDLALEKITRADTKNKINEERRKIVKYIVRETDLYCLLRLLRNNSKRSFSSPFRGLIEKMPEIAKDVMDKCITSRWNKITFHYEILDDTFLLKDWPPDHDDYLLTWEHCRLRDIATREEYTNSIKKMKNNHPLKLMIKGRRTETSNDGIYQQLLDHPLVKALVRRKWNHIGVKFHVLNLALYLIYLAVLTLCVSTTVPPYVHSQSPSNPFTYRNTTACQNVTLCQKETSCQNGNACQNTTICHDTTTCLNKITTEAAATKMTCHSFESHRKSMIVDLQYFVIALSLIMILKEVYQLVKTYQLEYFKQVENYVELAVYISSVLFVVNVTECEDTDYRTKWQWILGILSVFMAWINLLVFAKKFDRLGIYVMMLGSIIKTFLLNVFPIVAVLLIAFALAFTCVHQDQVKFANLWHSILTTTSFMISGFDYEEFLSLVNYHDIAFVSYIIYSLFQFLMTIVIINLMVGVAVENVQEIHKDASAMNTVLQIEYTLELEGMIYFISSKLRNICDIEKFRKWVIFKPNEEIELAKLKSTILPVQQIVDLIDKYLELQAKSSKNGGVPRNSRWRPRRPP
ncbi:transient receptor potential cation channel subfamily A member 1 homolog [Mercenaria mercenaria]|uniref:transient receptor potential cation channel subfamily A member 1 homolog n=1 Tax=Mercenaria mercenaria TaxID=6596 RepID=UPI00234E55F8|nr:transient receptor potential cation channel subfamily A member 1 homolog [Mercenaria mercenaria]